MKHMGKVHLHQADTRPSSLNDSQKSFLLRHVDTNAQVRFLALHHFQECLRCWVGVSRCACSIRLQANGCCHSFALRVGEEESD